MQTQLNNMQIQLNNPQIQIALSKNQRVGKNLETFDIKGYDKLDEFISLNSGLTTTECIKKIKFHKFTSESFEYLINQINSYRATWSNIGPFKKNISDTWYNTKSNKLQTIENLLKENLELKEKNKSTQEQLSNLLIMFDKTVNVEETQ